MADQEVTVDLSGNSSDLEQAFDRTGDAANELTRSVGSAEEALATLGRASGGLGEGLDRASGAASMLSGGIGDLGGAFTAFTDLQDLSATKAQEQAQATLNLEKAQKNYNETLKKYGEGSIEARQAQLDLNAAQMAAEPPSAVAEWGQKLEMISPIIMGIVGVTDLLILANTALSASWLRTAATATVSRIATIAGTAATGVATAAQWLWNIAMTANPIGLIIAAVVALIGIIVLIATKTTWFQDLWKVTWDAIKTAAMATWKWISDTLWPGIKSVAEKIAGAFMAIPGLIKSAFSGLVSIITWPFRTGFNLVADAWNNTVGKLSWSIPSWVPIVGGKTISAPKLPKFHDGIDSVPGVPGSEMLAILQAGERVIPNGEGNGRTVIELRSDGSQMGDLLVSLIAGAIRRKGGDPIEVLTSG